MECKGCREIPPVSSDYTPKGTYEIIAGLKTYVIGPPSPQIAIIDVYDVFGPAPQTLQGADRLSASLNALVIVPDFCKGVYMQEAWMPPDTDEKKGAIEKFLSEPASIPKNADKVIEVRKVAGEKWPSTGDRWGVFGLCWGGKIAVLVSGKGNDGPGRVFKASGTAHPGRLEAADAEALTAPHICLASPGEPADIVAQYKEILEKPGRVGVVETYESMFHGWMGARANLDDENNKKEFERGYNQVAEFFGKYL
ncbi:alpha/beta-hydrolase [Annulohypoxylon maeteangense]|uniref:alpha/beta-hydrolase n=1 Tax=Annulohypoxylon maeteangense TaxID=1927788 RepID=UPI002008A104|nr:alpha/beta-hydrolase [Annulohypoxylon maeteangense]KAI0880507.1 alpha/beta-hydrolase [Annulohypoxylon maeteangense]